MQDCPDMQFGALFKLLFEKKKKQKNKKQKNNKIKKTKTDSYIVFFSWILPALYGMERQIQGLGLY